MFPYLLFAAVWQAAFEQIFDFLWQPFFDAYAQREYELLCREMGI